MYVGCMQLWSDVAIPYTGSGSDGGIAEGLRVELKVLQVAQLLRLRSAPAMYHTFGAHLNEEIIEALGENSSVLW